MGREKTERWGPRVIDIDLLLYGEEEIRELDLVVPHRELMNRRFVLVPLTELLPDGPLRDRMQEREEALRSAQPVRAWPVADSHVVPSTPNDR
jgi:7,8-dihydro-6-hydroxymethylpterin-pyrophosphokinase